MELLYALLTITILLVVCALYIQQKHTKGIHAKIAAAELDTQKAVSGIVERLDEGKETLPTSIYPIAGTSLEGISFYDFFEAKSLEQLKQIELRSADIIVVDILNKLGYCGIGGHGIQILASISHLSGVENQELLLTFTKEAAEKLKMGAAKFVIHKDTGLAIPQLRDVATGQWMEHGKLMLSLKSTPKLLIEIGKNALPGLIAIAHIISNYDINRQLKQIGKDIKFLKTTRLYDQKAELIACFGKLQQAVFLPEPHRGIELARIHFDLQKLRNVWSMEIEGILLDVKDARPKMAKKLHLNQAGVSRNNETDLINVKERLFLAFPHFFIPA